MADAGRGRYHARMLLWLLLQETVWTLDTKSPSYGSGAVADVDGDGKPEIVFGTYYNDEHLYCVNAEDGSVAWKHKSDGGPMDASVAIADLDGDGKLEILAADSSSGRLFCLGGDGAQKWTLQLPNSTDSPPAVADLDGDGVFEIVVGSMWKENGNGDVTVYRADTRAKVWGAEMEGCVQAAPCLVDLDADEVLDVVVTTWRGTNAVHAFSGKDGATLWTFETDIEGDESMGLYHGVSAAFVAGQWRIAFGTCSLKRGTLYVVDGGGHLQWKQELGEYLFAPTTMADLDGDGAPEVIAVGESTYAYTLDGKRLWKAEVGGARGVAAAGGRLFLGARGRRVVALDGKTGAEVWSVDAKIGDSPYEDVDFGPLVFQMDGAQHVFVVGGKGTSDETKAENYGRAMLIRADGEGDWAMFQGNLKRTGATVP